MFFVCFCFFPRRSIRVPDFGGIPGSFGIPGFGVFPSRFLIPGRVGLPSFVQFLIPSSG